MSSYDQALASLISQIAFSFDGAVLGVALAYAAVRTIFRFKYTSTALRKIGGAPSVRVADLRSLLEEERSNSTEEPIVVVRGAVEARPATDGLSWKGLKSNVLVSQESGDKAVIIQRSQTVPFILVEGGKWPQSDSVIVNMDGSRHPLPLTTVGLLNEEKILPLGKEITAVGICGFNNGVPEIKSCKELPYFLSDKTKDQMMLDLAFKTKILLWSGVVFGSLSIGILGYAFVRNWKKWKEWRQRRAQQSIQAITDEATSEITVDEDTGDIPDGELCVVCLMRRRRSAFIPCGHLVCCQRCAISVEREVMPKCPVCRMSIRSSVRIYAS
ncbi:Zinc finger, RING/FYVE/PHD-type [Corchorus olitorius]|uniref:RING-type E3 ubiquitin transferase n=1 Tax=Corchorus olitorius TaxID=93759 RepID=A0A1R3H709_9ROSI|nr:Zinc finger, RING/FYVE/PHD-type [Corchorus olitorius]